MTEQLLGDRRENQLLIFQNFIESRLILLDYALIGEDCLLVLHDGTLVGEDRFLVSHDCRLVGQDCLLLG